MTHEGTQPVNFPVAKGIKTLSVYLSFTGILIRLFTTRLSNNACRTTATSGKKTLFQKAVFAALLNPKDYMNIMLQLTVYLL